LYSVEKLEIRGYRAKAVPNTFFEQETGANQLAIVYPGYAYRCDGPLLWYPTRILLSLGADVLWVEYPYDNQPEWEGSEHRMEWLSEDSTAAFALATKRRAYGRVTLIGKSLGTIAMGKILASGSAARDVRGVWMTPVLTDPDLRQVMEEARNPSLIIIGSADHYYDASFLERLCKKTSTKVLILEGADHILESKDGTIHSIDTLKKVMESVQRFVAE
jgi:predicted alpha/beta-hydrolase family hydrolase